MSPLPDPARLGEYAVKAGHLALRSVGRAPEQCQGRRLAEQRPLETPTGRRVAIFTLRDWAAHVTWETVIGEALRLRGADVHFVTCGGGLEICDRANTYEGPPMPCRSCRRYVEDSVAAHAFEATALRDEWSSAGAKEWPELDELSLAELQTVVDPESHLELGRLVRIPVSWFLLGSRLESDPLAALTYRRFLRAGRLVARAVAGVLDRVQPEVVLLLNGLFFFEAIAWELCARRGVEVVTYERGFIKETLLFRRGAPACLGDVGHLWPAWSGDALTEGEQAELGEYLGDRRLGRRTIDRYWVNPRLDPIVPSTSGRLVTLFTNLTWDSAVIGQEVAFPSIQEWLVAAIDAFADRPEHQLVVRIHPAEVKLPGKQTREPLGAVIRDRFPVLPANVRVVGADDPQSSYPLMEASDLGLVFTSTTGLEMALHGKPVIVAGRTHYRGKGFTTDVSSPEEFLAALDRGLRAPDELAPDVDLVERYAYLFFFRAPVASPGVEEHVPGLARITVDELADLAPGRSESIDRIATLILEGRDQMEDVSKSQ